MSAFQPGGGAMECPPLFPQKRPRSPGGTPRGSQHPRFGAPLVHHLMSASPDDAWAGAPNAHARGLQAGEQQYRLASLDPQASSEAVFLASLELVSSPSSPWAPQLPARKPPSSSSSMQVPKRYNLPALSVAHSGKHSAAHLWHKALAPALEVGSPSPSLSSASCLSSCPSAQSSPAPHRHSSGSFTPTSHSSSPLPGTPSASHFAGHYSSSSLPTPGAQCAGPCGSSKPSAGAHDPAAFRAPLLICTTSCASSDLEHDPSACSSFSVSASAAALSHSHGASSSVRAPPGAPLGLHRLHSTGFSGPLDERPAWGGASRPLDGGAEGLEDLEGMGCDRDGEEGSCCSGSAESMDEGDAASPLARLPRAGHHPQAHAHAQSLAQAQSELQWREHRAHPLNALLSMDRCNSRGYLGAPTAATAGAPPLPQNQRPALPPPASPNPSAAPALSELAQRDPCGMGAFQVGAWSLPSASYAGLPALGAGPVSGPSAQGAEEMTTVAPRCAERRQGVRSPPLAGLLSRALQAQHAGGEPRVHREGDGGYSILVDLNSEPGADREQLTRSRREILGTRHGTPSRRWL